MVASLLCGKGVPGLSLLRVAESERIRAGPRKWSVTTEPSIANMHYYTLHQVSNGRTDSYGSDSESTRCSTKQGVHEMAYKTWHRKSHQMVNLYSFLSPI
jgi:hypothetical protein